MVKKIEYLIIIALSVMIFFYSFIDVAIYDNNTQESTGVFYTIVTQNKKMKKNFIIFGTRHEAIKKIPVYEEIRENSH